jgi:pilus assembly protein Flp/PilA
LPTERNRPATVINPINASETAAVYEHHGNAMKGTEMRDLLTAFAKDESGATAIEYGLIAAALGTGIIVAVNTLGSQLKATFSNLSSQLARACVLVVLRRPLPVHSDARPRAGTSSGCSTVENPRCHVPEVIFEKCELLHTRFPSGRLA